MSVTLGAVNEEIRKRKLKGKWEKDSDHPSLGAYRCRQYIIETPWSKKDNLIMDGTEDFYREEYQNKKVSYIKIVSLRSWQSSTSSSSLSITPNWARVIDYISNRRRVFFDRAYRFVVEVKENKKIASAFDRLELAEKDLGEIVEKQAMKLLE